MIQKVDFIDAASAWRSMKGMLTMPPSMSSVSSGSTVVRTTLFGSPICSRWFAFAGPNPGEPRSCDHALERAGVERVIREQVGGVFGGLLDRLRDAVVLRALREQRTLRKAAEIPDGRRPVLIRAGTTEGGRRVAVGDRRQTGDVDLLDLLLLHVQKEAGLVVNRQLGTARERAPKRKSRCGHEWINDLS
jgi:hypothetical protein